MEFKRGNSERREDRRICPQCLRHCGARERCKPCDKPTKARIRIVWTVDGKRSRKLTDAWREEDAREVLQAVEAEYWRKQRLGVARDVGGTLESAITAFEQAKKMHSGNWRSQIRKALYPLRDGLGGETIITEVSRDDLQQYLDEGLETNAPTTMRSYMTVVRCFFNWLEEEGWIRFNPSRRIKLPKAEQRRGDFLMPEQVGPMLDACFRVRPDFAPMAMAVVLGSFRKGELVNLRRQDVDLTRRWAFVLENVGDEAEEAAAWSPKTESSRRAVPLHPLLVETLRGVEPVKRPDGSLSPWMFPVSDARKRSRFRNRRGALQRAVGDRRAPDTTFFGRCLKLALAEAGISRPVTMHGLRRTFGVLLQDVGCPDSVIRQAMGHEPIGVTARHYLPRRDAVVQRWVDRIEVALPSAPYLPPVAEKPGAKTPPALYLVR
ncbi:tyrosine-type recombinase/integrase [Haliangium ochraceum]|uniref:Integrase family protein n=1 Tax=Haliangium ochraceum (strain DSM 14365 / JCM 11303 / SMP-2) TaxID=502025 RepID=D0LNC0_HALO1|nr:tyrosine-type recombinase/integrase [Haliangium ochraceum]ACY15297.1 integrase family protein [Haliangium ochraceum DSM 14365]